MCAPSVCIRGRFLRLPPSLTPASLLLSPSLSLSQFRRIKGFWILFPRFRCRAGESGGGDVYECPRRFRNLNFIRICPYDISMRDFGPPVLRRSPPTDPSCALKFAEGNESTKVSWSERGGIVSPYSRINVMLDI